jgi:DNA-3-methyladenine glycosylase I
MDKIRCAWCEKDDLYRNYHDEEWGKPVYDDETLFEFLVLESFQAGLSWYTILVKRESFRTAFEDFAEEAKEKTGEVWEKTKATANNLTEKGQNTVEDVVKSDDEKQS